MLQYKLIHSETCVKRPLSKKTKIGFQYQVLINAGQKYCRMLQWEHSAILSTFIKLPFLIKISVLSFLSGRFTQALLYCLSNIFDPLWTRKPQKRVLLQTVSKTQLKYLIICGISSRSALFLFSHDYSFDQNLIIIRGEWILKFWKKNLLAELLKWVLWTPLWSQLRPQLDHTIPMGNSPWVKEYLRALL